ncbi:unknown similar to AMEV099 [Mythimna separata entomopoxvirus 'L']|uniref:Uncharacterized protein n=1 Tax=Mythimna separata entomopoxvirus 'L' TaxID=1293572 RepID=A0A916P7G4_9POXV|nr:unknown similar to AMEV099 [Mythimna separata entomopoxvirus 'L']CCU56336.1 unknown similar to AMEV099 [Mythimna separata entomopoxvirus 'L']
MKDSYINLVTVIINSAKIKNQNIDLYPVNYENDEFFIKSFYFNDFMNEKNFNKFSQEEWIKSMNYVYLKMFSFWRHKSGTLLDVYNMSDEENKKIILKEYKKLINKINIDEIKQKIIYNAKEQLNISENINYKLDNIIKNIKNYKDPIFIAHLIDLFFYDKNMRNMLIENLNKYIPLNKEYENSENDEYIEECKYLIKILMNINIGTVKATQDLKDYITTFIGKLFDTSEFLNKCILSFTNNSETKFRCCNIKKAVKFLDCDEFSMNNIKYNENTSGYRPLHIKSHIIHIILKFLNISIYCYKNDIINKYKTKVNNSEIKLDFDNKFDDIKNILEINPNDKIDIFNIINQIYNNREKLNQIFEENKENIKEYIKNKINNLDITPSMKENICKLCDSTLEEINISKLPDLDVNNINEKFSDIMNQTKNNIKPLMNIVKKGIKTIYK